MLFEVQIIIIRVYILQFCTYFYAHYINIIFMCIVNMLLSAGVNFVWVPGLQKPGTRSKQTTRVTQKT